MCRQSVEKGRLIDVLWTIQSGRDGGGFELVRGGGSSLVNLLEGSPVTNAAAKNIFLVTMVTVAGV